MVWLVAIIWTLLVAACCTGFMLLVGIGEFAGLIAGSRETGPSTAKMIWTSVFIWLAGLIGLWCLSGGAPITIHFGWK
jgi:hypothetical protein